jgi:hypothetical protein
LLFKYSTLIIIFCLATFTGCATKTTRTPTSPSGDPSDFQYKESDCLGTTYDMMICLKGKAYESARELDTLLLELDKQFPNRAWEDALEDMILPQEKWESLKISYCEYESQKYIGGTIYSNTITSCISEQNTERIQTLMQVVCMKTSGFLKCPPKKPGGEEPFITAIPTQ